MDLELTDEQQWLSEAVETLLGRVWPGSAGSEAGARDPEALWEALVAFGALSVDRDEGLGAVELCLVSRALGASLARAPYVGSAALRFAAEPLADRLPEAYARARPRRRLRLRRPAGAGAGVVGHRHGDDPRAGRAARPQGGGGAR